MFIQEVEIFKILGCKSLELSFSGTNRCPVYIVKSEIDGRSHNILTLAVQLICSSKYSHIASLTEPMLNNICEGGVRIKFILPLPPGRDILDAIGIQFDGLSQRSPSEISDDIDGACGDEIPHFGRISADTVSVHEFVEGGAALPTMPTTSKDLRERESISLSHRGKRWQRRSTIRGNNVRKFLLINAYRDFSKNPEDVYYSINDGPFESCSLPAFHGRFYICMDYMLPQLENLSSEFRGDWLELLVSDINDKWNRREQLYDPFERFVRLFLKYGYPEQHLFPQLTRTHLLNMETMHTIQKTYAIKILRDTRTIFEFITAGEYTVWFYIPHYGRYADAIVEVVVEDLNFEYMVTYVQNTTQLIKRVWTEAPKAIKDLLMISFQLSLAFHCKQQIIYLQNFKEICQYQAVQLANFAYWQSLGVSKTNWTCKNYLQRIIDVCINSGTTAIIEYPGGVPLHPVNAYMIKIYQVHEEDKTYFDMKIVNGDQYSFDYFLDCLKDGLRSDRPVNSVAATITPAATTTNVTTYSTSTSATIAATPIAASSAYIPTPVTIRTNPNDENNT